MGRRLRRTDAPATTAHEARMLAREDRALELLIQGKSYAAIGEEIGVRSPTVREILASAQARRREDITDRAELWRGVMHERIEAGVRALWPAYAEGSIDAVKEMLKLLDRQARLWGLDLRPPETTVAGPQVIVIDARMPHEREEEYAGEAVEAPPDLPPPDAASRDIAVTDGDSGEDATPPEPA